MERNNNCPVVLYTAPDGTTQLDVKLENETVWLSVEQMAVLFDRDRSVIGKHIRNAFREGELIKEEVWAKFAHTTRHGSMEDKTQTSELDYYNLDVIISVGYRVKSIRGTHFRRWATTILKQYLIKGYAIDQRRLDHYNELKDVVKLMSRAISLQDKITEEEFGGLFNVIGDYVYALDTLDRYDYQELAVDKTTKDEPFHATYDNAMEAIRNVLARVGDKWSLLVLYTLQHRESVRFKELQRQIPDISQKSLTQTLRTLEEDGFVTREVFPEVPPRVEYTLTPRALSFLPLVENMIKWATENMEEIIKDREKNV